MSSCKRVIARLDIKGRRLIKGVRFEGLRVIGDACDAAEYYAKNGIDEIFYTDAVASLYGRNGLDEILRDTTKKIFVPITAGGAIRSVEDGRKLLAAGADKLAINSEAIKNPSLINKLSKKFGSQCVVLSIQVFYAGNFKWVVMIESGREKTKKDLKDWIIECQERGAGEIFLTSVDRDGTGRGPDFDLLEDIKSLVKIPLVLGGGFSSAKNVSDIFKNNTNLSGVSIGWALHYKKMGIYEAKESLRNLNLPVRDVNNNFEINSIKEKLKVSIIDYGMGNIQSLINAFNLLGIRSELTTDIEDIRQNKLCVLPGVGAFPEGMKQLKKHNLIEKLKEYSDSGGCLIGICLGMQLLLSQGTEYEKCEGLGIIPGIIEKLPNFTKKGNETLLPHVGWNSIKTNKKNKFYEGFNNIKQYFVHSYALRCSKSIDKNIVFTSDFWGYEFAAMVQKYNTVGIQFHPERSGRDGLNLLKSCVNSLIS